MEAPIVMLILAMICMCVVFYLAWDKDTKANKEFKELESDKVVNFSQKSEEKLVKFQYEKVEEMLREWGVVYFLPSRNIYVYHVENYCKGYWLDCYSEKNWLYFHNYNKSADSVETPTGCMVVTNSEMLELLKEICNEGVRVKLNVGFDYLENEDYWIDRENVYSKKDGSSKPLGNFEYFELTRTTNLTPCANPKVTHWELFLEHEMLLKKKRQEDCHKFVDSILLKQRKYNDTLLKYDNLPTAPIVDFVSFENFCKITEEVIKFEDYEIINYILTKGLKPH